MAWGKKKDGQSYVKTEKKGQSGISSKTEPVSDVHLKESPKMSYEDYKKLTPEEKEKIEKERKESNKKEIEELIKDLDEDWLIAALVEGSIGYYSPHSGMMTLHNMINEGDNYSERNMTVFHGNPVEELKSDIQHFKWIAQNNPAEAKRLIEFVRANKEDSDFARNGTFSSMYPTRG